MKTQAPPRQANIIVTQEEGQTDRYKRRLSQRQLDQTLCDGQCLHRSISYSQVNDGDLLMEQVVQQLVHTSYELQDGGKIVTQNVLEMLAIL